MKEIIKYLKFFILMLIFTNAFSCFAVKDMRFVKNSAVIYEVISKIDLKNKNFFKACLESNKSYEPTLKIDRNRIVCILNPIKTKELVIQVPIFNSKNKLFAIAALSCKIKNVEDVTIEKLLKFFSNEHDNSLIFNIDKNVDYWFEVYYFIHCRMSELESLIPFSFNEKDILYCVCVPETPCGEEIPILCQTLKNKIYYYMDDDNGEIHCVIKKNYNY